MLLEVENLSIRYGKVEAVNGLNLTIDQGRVIALLGANGAGKSSAAKAISLIIPWYSGEIRFNGESMRKMSPSRIVRLGIAQVPEGRLIFPGLTVRENLVMGGYTNKWHMIRNSISEVLSLFPILQERLGQLAGTLSGGEQQMLAIGRALMVQPKLLILDEPSLGLAPILIQTIYRTIAELKLNKTAILLIEQNIQHALSVADYVYVLQHGSIVLEGSSHEFKCESELVKAYL